MTRFTRAALASAALFFLSSICVAVDYGLTSGSFDVTPGGAATYSLPIWTPPGPNGIQPDLSLTYTSQGPNGVAGVGWNLNAVTSIQRCPRNIGQDGVEEGILLTNSDRYCLGGNRLRLISGTYGVAGSIYYTEIADYSRITAYGTQGNGPQYFVVEAKSGIKYEFGNSADSRVIMGGTTVLRWMVNKVYDRNGNSYKVTYNNATGFAVPDVISWTPTSLGAGTYRYEAKFNYINTRSDPDSYFGRVATYDLINRYRLESVQIKSASVVKRKYRFTYDNSTSTLRSRLVTAKECADDAETNCFLPLTFTYQTGYAGLTAGTGTVPAGSSNNIIKGRYDFNGDGKHDIAYWNTSTWYVALSTGSGFAGPYNTGLTATSPIVDNFLPNGRAAFIASVGGTLWSYRWDDSSSSFVAYNTGLSSGAPKTSLDYNGDGLADLIFFTSGSTSIQVRTNTSTGSGNPSFWSVSNSAQLSGNRIYGAVGEYAGFGLRQLDVNGDGRRDMGAVIVSTGPGGGATSNAILLGSTSGFTLPPESEWFWGGNPFAPILNFNGDSCSDRISGGLQIAACSGTTATTLTLPAIPSALLDWNADGKTDLLVSNGGTFGVYLSTGVGFSSLISTSIPSSGTFFDLDLDGDGLDDLVKVNGTSAISYWTHTTSGWVPTFATNVPDLLTSVTDGFGVNFTPSYVSTAWSNYTAGATTNYPLQQSPSRIVVAQVSSSDGIGGTFSKSYSYTGDRTDANRDEKVGFQRFDVTDNRTGIVTRTYLEQTFPVAGRVGQIEILQPGGTQIISRKVVVNAFSTLDSAANNQRYFVYSQGETATQYEVGGTWNGSLLRTVTTANLFHTATGMLYDQTVTTTEPVSSANGVTGGGSWTARTYTPTTSILNDTTTWCVGHPQQTQQINSSNLTYGTALTRTQNLTWNATYCRPTQTVDEPGSGTLQVTTDIGYDGFGNMNSTTVTGVGMTARTTSAVYSDATFTTGQFPLSVTNALNQTSTTAWNYDLGVPTSATDPNNLTTSWLYDAFGRRIRENRPDSTATTWSINNCSVISGGCVGANNRIIAIETLLDSGGTYVNDVWTYLDAIDRPIITTTRTQGGSYNRINREYDALGRVYRDSAPCIWVGCTTYWVTNTYDLASRLTATSRPISDSNSTPQTTNFYYEGLTTRVVDPQGKQASRVSNAAGQLARSADHDGYYQNFDYDAFGNAKRVTDTAGNVLQSSTYNLRGMLTQRVDMDMGTWNITPNALGETVSQTDAKSQSTTFVFDLLGRLTSRSEAEGTSTWNWGTSSASKNIGSLASVSGPGYSESYAYDSLGRPSVTSISADTTYQIDYAYNSLGSLDTLTYPTSTSSYRLKLKYDYQYGQSYRIRECATSACTTFGTTLWTASAVNGRNQVTQETLGNGLVTNRAFDAVTGWVKSIQTGLGGGSGVQNLAYTWDLAGNLASRKDVNQSNLTESFTYDNLYRMTTSTRNGLQNANTSYDTMGNINSKWDSGITVGTYTYHATKKHQVISTTGGWAFAYDNNGNMTSGRGATYAWTSYNYLSCVRDGAACSGTGTNYSSFSYTPDRQYWRQISNYSSSGTATTIYVGGILEKVTTSAATEYRHMIRAGGSTIIVSRQTTGTNNVYYATGDHLGSSSAITNSSGGMLVNSSFEAFGRRRGTNWSGNPSSADWTAIASTTRRGYTDHAMLDNLNLIHMNGRVQDPLLGRFISADPTIPSLSTQDFNRYSYVRNNPLTMSDPSGFAPGAKDHRRQYEDGDSGMMGAEEVGRITALTNWAAQWVGSDPPKMSDMTGMQWAQTTLLSGFRGVNGDVQLRSVADQRVMIGGREMQYVAYTGPLPGLECTDKCTQSVSFGREGRWVSVFTPASPSASLFPFLGSISPSRSAPWKVPNISANAASQGIPEPCVEGPSDASGSTHMGFYPGLGGEGGGGMHDGRIFGTGRVGLGFGGGLRYNPAGGLPVTPSANAPSGHVLSSTGKIAFAIGIPWTEIRASWTFEAGVAYDSNDGFRGVFNFPESPQFGWPGESGFNVTANVGSQVSFYSARTTVITNSGTCRAHW